MLHQLLLTTTNTPSTMMGMVLDVQWTTQTLLTTSLAKTGSQKSELLKGFSPATTSPDANTSTPVMTPSEMTPLVKSSLFNDTPHEENLPQKSPSSFSARPSPNASSPSAASIAEATARLKTSLNQPPIRNRILTRYFFQTYSNLIMTNK